MMKSLLTPRWSIATLAGLQRARLKLLDTFTHCSLAYLVCAPNRHGTRRISVRGYNLRVPLTTRPNFAVRAARFLATLLGLLGLGVGAALVYCMAMPGHSFHAEPLPLSVADQKLAKTLRTHVSALAAEIGPRRAALGDSLQRAEAYLTLQLSAAAPLGRLRREPLQGAPGVPANVILDLPGATEGPIVLIGAHYDSAPGGTPGANDNASGTAAALVLAAGLAGTSHRLPLRFVMFANEEQPYYRTEQMGSYQHAAGCKRRGEQLRAMLSLETMGYYSDRPGSQDYPPPVDLFYSDRGDFLGFVGNLASRPLLRETIRHFRKRASLPSEGAALPDALPGVGWSDHWSFWQFGYQAIMLTDTALFRDPNYHEITDVVDNLDFERLARAVIALQYTIEQLAQ